jgi:ABC-type glutathione transport system ATPase component
MRYCANVTVDSTVFFEVPLRRNHKFIGRNSILEELHRNLSEKLQYERVVALHGMSGAGKTEIALQYAYLFRSRQVSNLRAISFQFESYSAFKLL